MKKSYKTFVPFFLILSTSLFIDGCRQKQSDDEGSQSAAKAVVTVKVGAVSERDAAVVVEAIGKTDAMRKEKSYAPIAGRIITFKALEGTEVKKGDVLAIIQTKESEATILGAESMLRSAVTAEQKSEAEHILQLARSTQNSINVYAKFDGVVSTRSVSEGELVAENAELFAIVDLSTIDFLADVPLRDVSSVQRGERASVSFQSVPAKLFPAIVDAMNPQTDIQSQTVKVRLRFSMLNNSILSLLRTEMIGTAQITTGVRRHALFVPKAALLRNDEDNSYSVVMITADSLAKVIPVVVGTSDENSAEIRSEQLRAGMMIVTEGNYALTDSTRLSVAR
ncbi:MAG: efflux RND transporter periplasmic adaptor subunit [Bacteroidota bacterium]